MRLILFIIASFTFLSNSFACINGETRYLKNGILLFEDYESAVPHGHHFYLEDFPDAIIKLDSLYNATKNLDYLSDKGVLLILLSKYDEAIKLYLGIEKIQPNRYSTASNLGTAYELNGENENALKWIKRAVEIDPSSHHSSEWIHVKILEAKIGGKEFYNSNFLLNIDFGNENLPKTSLSKEQLTVLHQALYYQLNERISFVKPKDEIVAVLLYELGNIAFLLENYNNAIGDYEQAIKYGYENDLMTIRKNESEKIIIDLYKNMENKTKFQKYLIYGGITTLILILIVFIFFRMRK